MQFIKLEILNLASLDRQGGETINFNEGALGDSTIFSIVGPTGSGKSTILDAICLALYNRAPRYPRKKGDRNQNIEIFGELEEGEKNRLAPTDSRNILTRGKKEGYSKLTFLANNGSVYRAEWSVRKMVKNYGDAITSLFKITIKNGVPTEEQAEWNELPQIIGLDYEQFLRTVLIAQGSFSSFIKAKEDERYELLEKLIGCEELYTNIAAKIKQQKEEAVRYYNQIATEFSVHEKDIISEDEHTAITTRIAELETMEKQAKVELDKVKEDITWYTVNEKFLEDIAKHETNFREMQREKDVFREQAERLSLYDATHPAIVLYKDIKTAEANVAEKETELKSLGETIIAKEKEIKFEEEEKLATLTHNLEVKKNELEQQKPHINAARAIIVELEVLKKKIDEKTSERSSAEKAKKKADKEFDDNEEAIKKADIALRNYQQTLAALQEKLKKQEASVKQAAEDARVKYNEENTKLEEYDAAKLQDEKTCAENTLTELKSAIRIQEDLHKNCTAQEESLIQQKQLIEENNTIAEQLKSFNIEKLSEELDTLNKSYTLMTSENWEQHRADLAEGKACPLCGSSHHPYSDASNVAPVVDKMKSLIAEKSETLYKQRDTKQQLANKQSENNGKLAGIDMNLKNIETVIAKLNNEWDAIHAVHKDWLADVKALHALKPKIEKNVEDTGKKLKAYNDLVKLVDKLRKEKEAAEKAQQEYEKTSMEKKQVAEKKENDAKTFLVTEMGKTQNLKTQKEEKAKILKSAIDALTKVELEVSSKTETLKQEIGDKNPDNFEKELEEAKKKAEYAVTIQNESIYRLHGQLKKMKGKEEATRMQRDSELKTLNKKKEEFTKWLSLYNEGETEKLTEDTIALLYSATDDWEKIRAKQKNIDEKYTSSETTLNNEIRAHITHQEKKPEKQKEELLARLTELESRSNEELINFKARLQRHNTAKEQMGAMFDQKQEAELHKREWEEITDAIGSDGKTLRKIAQCYTLRFLIEHANVEIRKFNNRYELQQVKNSLGIRVIDHDRADDVRDTTSLSGGETFIVSLGLALGLSALSSRNISFENLFIDEGFGTLDPDTLATVIDSLSMLQSSQGKKVGVISHTDTMSERITTQIRIIKNGNSGSSHIEIYP